MGYSAYSRKWSITKVGPCKYFQNRNTLTWKILYPAVLWNTPTTISQLGGTCGTSLPLQAIQWTRKSNSSKRSFCISSLSMTDLKVMAWWQGFGKGSSKCMLENLLQYVCHIKGTKHIPHKAPALTYLTVFEYSGTLTWSWKSFVILNHSSSKSLLMSSPKRLQVEGSASRIWAPGNSEKRRIIQALLEALTAPPD